MTKEPNPDIFRPIDVPVRLQPYVRRALIADTHETVDFTADVRATGYHYLGWTWRGGWQGIADGEILFDNNVHGQFFLSGQVKTRVVQARMHGMLGQIFLEFSALGHFQLLGISGAELLENAVAPQVQNPVLQLHLDQLTGISDMSATSRIEHLADALCGLPKHPVPAGIVKAIDRMEAEHGDIRIGAFVQELCLPERKFRADFEMLIGLSPKTFCKTLQVNRALNLLLHNYEGDLAGVAAQSGFSDQAHFTRVFGDFLGKAPATYLENIEVTLARFLGNSRPD